MIGIGVFTVIGLFIVFLVFYFRSVNKNVIQKHDRIYLQTRGGKRYLWTDVQSIRYGIGWSKQGEPRKLGRIIFYFKDGLAITGNRMRNFKALKKVAEILDVPKRDKVESE